MLPSSNKVYSCIITIKYQKISENSTQLGQECFREAKHCGHTCPDYIDLTITPSAVECANFQSIITAITANYINCFQAISYSKIVIITVGYHKRINCTLLEFSSSVAAWQTKSTTSSIDDAGGN